MDYFIIEAKMISYDDIILFSTVAKVGSFIDTAKILGISHTTVARRIKNLEDSLGVILINRTTHNFNLTFIGQQIYNTVSNYSDNYISTIEQIKSIVSPKKKITGSLTIALPPILHKYILIPYILEFIKLYPDIHLNLRLDVHELNLIKENIDLAISFYLPKQQNQKFKKLFKDQINLYCTKQYIEKYGTPKTPLDLQNHLIILSSAQKSEYKFTNIHSGDVMYLKYNSPIYINNFLHSIEYVLTNEAIVPINKVIANKLTQTYELVHILSEYHILDITYYIFSNQFANHELINLFIDFLLTQTRHDFPVGG